MQRSSLASLLSALFALPAAAADNAFTLGTIEIRADAGDATPGETTVEAATLAEYNRDTVSDAARLVPGVALTRNSRNEDLLYVRGFDPRQTPLFVDGVPVYVPYDGYVDFGRFTTFDLAEVRVAKGAASLIYGPNTLGGAINLVTRKPTRAFEGDASVGVFSGNGRKASVNLGGKQALWYWQLGASTLDASTFPLSKDYTPTPGDAGGNRDNAYRHDRKLSFKLGLTPNASDEYAIGYVAQRGDKGNPSYAGTAPGTLRYWQWPYWDKDSLYAVARVGVSAHETVRARVYDDQYRNSLIAFTNGSYTTPINNSSFPSWYDDSSRGGSIELDSDRLAGHVVRFATHYKQDRHAETTPLSAAPNTRRYGDTTVSFVVEDEIALAPGWRARMGASHDHRRTDEAYAFARGDAAADNWLAELAHDVAPGAEWHVSVAKKSRFPTIKDRYSFRMGTALPNPDLAPETALHTELGGALRPWAGATLQGALFNSAITDLMQNVAVPSAACGGVTCNQLQNIGRARHRGVELALEQTFSASLRGGFNYTLLDRRNLSNPATPLTDTPRHRLFAHADWDFLPRWNAQLTVEHESGRKVQFGSTANYVTLDSFTSVGARVAWQAQDHLTVEAGVTNLGDVNYALAEGFPMPGRMGYANLRFDF